MSTKDSILQYIQSQTEISYTDLRVYFQDINESTLARNLTKLIQDSSIQKRKQGKNTFYAPNSKDVVLAYLRQDFFERPKKEYDFDFLDSYTPNVSSFLGKRYDQIKTSYSTGEKILSTYDYKENIRGIENILIDLSYASSKLEGNTYNYLDTEILIKYNSSAEGKTQVETQMILNHKNAIKYIIENRNDIEYSKIEFYNIHKLLGEGLLLEQYLGAIRKGEVKIGGSTYTPMDNKFQLEEQFDIFLTKLRQIKNPFEQSVFILVFIPYFQVFMDINKRVSRISANLPLIKNGLSSFSFLQIKERDYINAILAIYELHNTDLMADLFVENYLRNMKRYI